jgi:hypothetical protein
MRGHAIAIDLGQQSACRRATDALRQVNIGAAPAA